MNVRLANKVLLSVAVSAATLSALAACDLGLAPFEPRLDSGTATPIDTGTPPDPVVDSGSTDAAKDAGDAGATVKRAFVTSTTTRGNFGGQAGGDNICQNLASTAKLGGRFVAWLSETGKPAIDHITDVGPWFLVDGRTQVFANKAAIVAAGPSSALDTDEKGKELGNGLLDTTRVFTGTLSNGLVPGPAVSYMCNDWKSEDNNVFGLTGDYDKRTAEWTQRQAQPDSCRSELRLYCFEQ